MNCLRIFKVQLRNAKAADFLGQKYESGMPGELERNTQVASQWYQQAAKSNFAPAQYQLGKLYLREKLLLLFLILEQLLGITNLCPT